MTGGKQEEGGCLVSVTNLLIIIKFYDQRPLLSGVIYFKVNENQDVMEKDTKKIYDHFTNPISTSARCRFESHKRRIAKHTPMYMTKTCLTYMNTSIFYSCL